MNVSFNFSISTSGMYLWHHIFVHLKITESNTFCVTIEVHYQFLITFAQNKFLSRESIHSEFGKSNKHYKRDVKNPNHGKFLKSSTVKINTKNIKKFDYERANKQETEEEICEVQAGEFLFTNPIESEDDMEVTE